MYVMINYVNEYFITKTYIIIIFFKEYFKNRHIASQIDICKT